jgi:hypothetical protein
MDEFDNLQFLFDDNIKLLQAATLYDENSRHYLAQPQKVFL